MCFVRREQSSSIAMELTFAPPQSMKGSIHDYIWSKHLLRLCIVFTINKVHVLAPKMFYVKRLLRAFIDCKIKWTFKGIAKLIMQTSPLPVVNFNI